MLMPPMMIGLVVARARHETNRPLEEGGLLAAVVQAAAYLETWGGRWAVHINDE